MARSRDTFEILFEDDHLIAVVKPAGLPTANAAPGAESLFTLLKERFGPAAFVGIVSRLDAPVSGVVVVAKTPAAAGGLAEQFRERLVEKAYSAVVTGRFPAPLAHWVDWNDAVSRRPGERTSVLHPAGDAREGGGDASPRAAHVRARVVRRAGEVSLVELEPSTGRRHQLRLQLASRGCPIVGDRLYGSRLPFPAGIALHARSLSLTHPLTGVPMTLESPCGPLWGRAFPSLFSGSAGR
ncbi:MAG: RluA family pseudouridine synthase [Pirellulales bacterium]